MASHVGHPLLQVCLKDTLHQHHVPVGPEALPAMAGRGPGPPGLLAPHWVCRASCRQSRGGGRLQAEPLAPRTGPIHGSQHHSHPWGKAPEHAGGRLLRPGMGCSEKAIFTPTVLNMGLGLILWLRGTPGRVARLRIYPPPPHPTSCLRSTWKDLARLCLEWVIYQSHSENV